MQVIVLSVVLRQLVYWWYVTSTKAAAVWWGPVLALVVAFMWPPGHVRLGEAGAAVGKIQTSGRKRMNDAVTIGMAATAVGTVPLVPGKNDD